MKKDKVALSLSLQHLLFKREKVLASSRLESNQAPAAFVYKLIQQKFLRV